MARHGHVDGLQPPPLNAPGHKTHLRDFGGQEDGNSSGFDGGANENAGDGDGEGMVETSIKDLMAEGDVENCSYQDLVVIDSKQKYKESQARALLPRFCRQTTSTIKTPTSLHSLPLRPTTLPYFYCPPRVSTLFTHYFVHIFPPSIDLGSLIFYTLYVH